MGRTETVPTARLTGEDTGEDAVPTARLTGEVAGEDG